jgi:hypothetical protein
MCDTNTRMCDTPTPTPTPCVVEELEACQGERSDRRCVRVAPEEVHGSPPTYPPARPPTHPCSQIHPTRPPIMHPHTQGRARAHTHEGGLRQLNGGASPSALVPSAASFTHQTSSFAHRTASHTPERTHARTFARTHAHISVCTLAAAAAGQNRRRRKAPATQGHKVVRKGGRGRGKEPKHLRHNCIKVSETGRRTDGYRDRPRERGRERWRGGWVTERMRIGSGERRRERVRERKTPMTKDPKRSSAYVQTTRYHHYNPLH